jgi:hypothetical protein
VVYIGVQQLSVEDQDGNAQRCTQGLCCQGMYNQPDRPSGLPERLQLVRDVRTRPRAAAQ